MEKVIWGFSLFGVGALAALLLLVYLNRARELNVKERQAWFTLGVFGIMAVCYLGAVVAARVPWVPAFSMWGLYGFTGVANLIGRGERREGRVIEDERDREIDRFSTIAGYSVFWLVFVLACMTAFFVKGPNATVTLPTSALTMPVFAGMIIIFTVKALVTVILYRRGSHGEATA